ncbi:MAG: ribonuclease H-like domain-containing protein [Myxococcota bacterium]
MASPSASPLGAKLSRLTTAPTTPGILGAKLSRLPAAPPRAPAPRNALHALIPARDTAHGPLHLVEHDHGPAPLHSAEALAALSLADGTLDTSRPLYFDTETTGLAGGTGTLAFLLGTAEPREGRTVISQVHLPGPGQERPLLQWLAERVEQATVLISFNGRSFDWPLLKARFVMNRLPPPPERPHVDLLHAARRVFRHHLDELKLTTLERRVLDVHRKGDLEGALIPAAWFDYLRTGRVAVLSRVLTHNERDVRSMVDLVQRLTAAWEERVPVLPETALGLAFVAARRGDDARALRFLERATAGRVASEAWSLHAELRRRRGEFGEAVAALHRALEQAREPAELHLKLAKLYEHRLRDYAAASFHAERCANAEPAETHLSRSARLAHRLRARDTTHVF